MIVNVTTVSRGPTRVHYTIGMLTGAEIIIIAHPFGIRGVSTYSDTHGIRPSLGIFFALYCQGRW